MERLLMRAAERGWVPERLLRRGLRRHCAAHLRELERGGPDAQAERQADHLRAMRLAPIASATPPGTAPQDTLPTAFFAALLGPRLKAGCAHWPEGVRTLARAEEAALELVVGRAELADGQRILELGCGWGALCMWLAERFPGATIAAVTASATQRAYIEGRAEARSLTNLRLFSADVAGFEPDGSFDRIVALELFERTRNWGDLLARIEGWLNPGGRVFVQVVAHQRFAWSPPSPPAPAPPPPPAPVEPALPPRRRPPPESAADWMRRTFLAGAMMPSRDLMFSFQRHLRVAQAWHEDGRDYARTCEAWLANLVTERAALEPLLQLAAPLAEHDVVWPRWRLFLMACAELFAFHDGEEWGLSHYLLRRVTRD